MSANTQTIEFSSPVRFLALGDSYTVGESVAQEKTWPFQFKHRLIEKGVNVDTVQVIAKTGWTTTDLKQAIAEQERFTDFNLVSLLIGVNNQYQGKDTSLYIQEFEQLLSTAIQLAGNKANVFVLSIPDYGFTPFGKKKKEIISREIDDYNRINKDICTSYGVIYIDITDISRQGLDDPELLAKDELHPSDKMYGLWVDRIFDRLILE